MPLYEYACQKCSHQFEELVFSKEEVRCPQCQAEQVERLLSVPARPTQSTTSLPTSCGEGPPCGAPWCQRKG